MFCWKETLRSTMTSHTRGGRKTSPATTQAVTKRGGANSSRSSNHDADVEKAMEMMEEALAEAQLSKETADEMQRKLTDSLAAAEVHLKQFAEMEAKMNAMEKTFAEASARRTSSDGDSGAGEGVLSKNLPAAMKANLTTHISGIFKYIKFINDDTLEAHPKIMTEACDAMGIKTALERSIYGNAAKREMKYLMSQKRAYCKKMVMKRYKGE